MNHHLVAVMSSMNDGFWDWRVGSTDAWYSPNFWTMLGFGAELEFPPATIQSYNDRVHIDDFGRIQEAIHCHIETGAIYDVKHRLKMVTGEYRWFRSRATLRRDPTGRPLHLAGSIQDVHIQHEQARLLHESERVATAALRELEFQKHAIDEHAIVSACGADGKMIYVNRKTCEISGYSRDELLGQNHRIHSSGLHTRQFWKNLYASVARDGVWNGEICNRAKDGRLYWMRTTVAAFRDPQGTIERYVAIRTEITEEKLKEEKLQEARRAADAANQAKTEFLSNMSHEIRTPLTAILGYVELLEDDNMASVPERRKEVLETIRSAGSHLLTIVNDILDLSKIDAGQLLVEHIETDIANLLRSIESLMRPRAAEKQLKFEVKFDTPIPTRAVTDPTRLRQILMNLLSNAIKFTAAGSVTLRLSVESEDAECVLRLAVEDTGMGITAEQARQLFSAFKQADATVTRRHGGTGLGLVICQRLAQLMGGHVELTASEPGKGSLFTAMIPMGLIAGAGCTSQLSAFTDSPSQVSSRTTVRLSGRILLAEDLPVNQRLISFHLTKAGAEVDVAEHGGVALLMIEKARANGNPYDLLLTDIQMPEMDGYALARTLRKRGCDIPIVALTAHVMLDDLQKCMEAGCTDYASKPIDKAVLLEKCSQWLDGRGTEAVGDGRQSLGHHSALIEMVPVSAD